VTNDKKTDEPEVDKSADDETGAGTKVAESDVELSDDDTDNSDGEEAPSEPHDTVVRRTMRGTLARIGLILLVAWFVASAGLASWLYFYEYRPDQQTNSAAAKVALEAASNGTVALLTYSPDSLDKDFAAAKTHLTGGLLSYYTQFTEQIVTPAVKQKSVKSNAVVVRSAVAEMHTDSAVVFVFVNQNTASRDNPVGTFAASAVKVVLKKIDGSWLISSFDPV
jgi:Mce-associated membrane protein